MSQSNDAIPIIDQAAIRLRVTLTIIKSRVQLTARRRWAMDETERHDLIARLTAIDETVNRAVEDLARLQAQIESDRGRPMP